MTSTKTSTKTLPISKIRTDGGTQMRVQLDAKTVDEYAEVYSEGGELPPVKVVYDGKDYWLWDGFTRIEARKKAGLADVDVEVTKGNQRDAVLLSCGANAQHGLKRSNADKRKAVETLLQDPEWAKWSDQQIADSVFVSQPFVRSVRESGYNIITSPDTRIGKDGKEYPAKRQPKPDSPSPTEPSPTPQQQVQDFFKDRSPAPAPAETQTVSAASIMRDGGGRVVPDHLRADQTGAALLQSLSVKVERLRTELDQASGERGMQFFDPVVAVTLDTLMRIKDDMRGAMFACECPRCKGTVNDKCERCDGHGYLPNSRAGKLSKDEQDYLQGK